MTTLRAHIHRGAGRSSPLPSAPSPPSSDAAPQVFTPPSAGPAGGEASAAALEPIIAALGRLLGSPELRRLGERMLGSMFATGTQAMPLAESAAAVVGLLGSAAGGVYDATLREAGQSTPEISTNELRRVVSDGSAHVFDTRTQLEYALGHVPGALNVGRKPGVAMSLYVSDAAEIERLVPSRSAPVVLYCNGPFCGKSRRLADDLVSAGFSHVRRYQLGTPVWRALVGPMVIEPRGVQHVLDSDSTAVFIDARPPAEFAGGSLAPARNVPPEDVTRAKDDGRLPMDDFNTRVVIVGSDADHAEAMAHVLVGQGFNNVKYHAGTLAGLLRGLVPGL